MTELTTLLVGIGTSLIVEGFKRLPSVPLVSGQVGRIRAVAGVFAFLGTLGAAVAAGDTDALTIAGQTVAAYLVSYLTYKGVLSGNAPTVPTTPEDGTSV